MKHNLILNSDSYKMSHFLFYPEGTTEVYSYMESRGGKYPSTVFFGLQGLIQEYLMTPITEEDIEYARDFAKIHGVPFNDEGWYHILNKHGGYLPVEIRAVKEGTVVDNRNVLMTVRNTDPAVPFITSYIETLALRLWYPMTVATRSFNMKRDIQSYFDMTSDTMDMSFALHDFSARGCTSFEANLLGGAAHLINFAGSDSMSAIEYVKRNYGGEIVGYSVPATEHSIMCAYGRENELASFERLIDQAERNSILSVVSDTWNIFEAVEKWISLKDKIVEKNITLVVRPDSGEIRPVLTAILTRLREGFGATTNSKGFDVLNNVKVLWGDGMDEYSITEPFDVAYMLKISADSIITGSGGGLMQANIDRDTNKFAFKASNVIVNGESIAIAKDPITDPGKMSKKGKFYLYNSPNAGWITSNEVSEGLEDQLELVYRDGVLLRKQTFAEIREIVKTYL